MGYLIGLTGIKLKLNNPNMKKLLLVLAIGTFAACNSGTSTENSVDSAAQAIDSSADAKIDSLQTTADSLSNKIDSAADAKTDALKGDTTKK